MAFVYRTPAEIMDALHLWFLNHPYPDKQFQTEDGDWTTPREAYSNICNNEEMKNLFCGWMAAIAKRIDGDPIEMIRDAAYDEPWKS